MFSDDLVNRLIRYPRAIASRIRIMRLQIAWCSPWSQMLDQAHSRAEESVGYRN